LGDLQEKRFHDVSGQDRILHTVLQKLASHNASIAKLDECFTVFKQNRSLVSKYIFESELKPFSSF